MSAPGRDGSDRAGGPGCAGWPRGLSGITAVVFDVDGVLVDSPHESAWREALRELMEQEWTAPADRGTWSPEAFTPAVYARLMAGRPRLDGARAALEHFGVPDAARRAETYAARKQAAIVTLIDAGAFAAFPDAVRLLLRGRAAGLRIAAASSSKNAGALMCRIEVDPDGALGSDAARDRRGEADHGPTGPHGDVGERGQPARVRPHVEAGRRLIDLLDADVSGRELAHGKPHPEIFLTAARELGQPPQACVVVEDAPSGIEAARAGGMGAVGIARTPADRALLEAAGAHLVVEDLDAVDLPAQPAGAATVDRRVAGGSATGTSAAAPRSGEGVG